MLNELRPKVLAILNTNAELNERLQDICDLLQENIS